MEEFKVGVIEDDMEKYCKERILKNDLMVNLFGKDELLEY